MTREQLILARLAHQHRRERIEALVVLGLCGLAALWVFLWMAVQ